MLFISSLSTISHYLLFIHTGACSLGSTVAMALEQIMHQESLMLSNSGITKQNPTWIFPTLMEMIGFLVILKAMPTLRISNAKK